MHHRNRSGPHGSRQRARGQGLAEYGILLALVAVGLVAVFTIVGGDLSASLTATGAAIGSVGPSAGASSGPSSAPTPSAVPSVTP
ncbi:MAG: hypothetical protein WCH74_01545, partial [Chloroflexota bacterium]